MSLRDESVRVVARDPRYPIDAYFFVMEALEHAKRRKYEELSEQSRESSKKRRKRNSEDSAIKRHVTGQELCRAAFLLAADCYGGLGKLVLAQWNIKSTSDMGEIVYNLIAVGDLEKTPEDAREDFNDVFDFDEAFKGYCELPDDVFG